MASVDRADSVWPLCKTIRTLCEVQACSNHNANYDFCGMGRLLGLWWEPKNQTGRGEPTMPHSCRVWQLSSEGRWRVWFSFIQSFHSFVLLWALRAALLLSLLWTDHPACTPIYYLSLTLWHFTESQSAMKRLDLSNNGHHVIYNLLVYINPLFRLCTIYIFLKD